MKKLATGLSIALLSAVQLVGAQTNCDPCGTPCCGTFEAFAHALYFQPSSCDHTYAVLDTTYFDRLNDPARGQFQINPVGNSVGTCPDYDWGFRVGVGYVSCDGKNDARIYYQRLHTTDRGSVTATGTQVLWPTDFMAGLVPDSATFVAALTPPEQFAVPGVDGIEPVMTNRVKYEWDALDLEVGARTVKDCRFSARGHIGLHWAQINYTREFTASGTTVNSVQGAALVNLDSAFVRNHSSVWGVGGRVGFDLRYDVACGFGVIARVGSALLAGEVKEDHHGLIAGTTVPATAPATTSATEFRMNKGSRCTFVPEFDFALGLDYEWTCSCVKIVGEVGYEWRTYLGAIHNAHFVDNGSANQVPVCDNFNLSGLFFGLRIEV